MLQTFSPEKRKFPVISYFHKHFLLFGNLYKESKVVSKISKNPAVRMKTNAVLVLAIVLVGSISTVAARAQLVEEYHHERIANGQIANPGAFPFVASHRMIDLRTGKFFHLCGATILSQNWLVTLASCIRYVSPNYNQVVVGAHHVRNDGITHSLQAVMRHPNYDYEIKNNIGLLRTKEPIKFTNAVRPIRFSRSKLTATNLPAVTIGWGDVVRRILDLNEINIIIILQLYFVYFPPEG